jgi:hypothetical protein
MVLAKRLLVQSARCPVTARRPHFIPCHRGGGEIKFLVDAGTVGWTSESVRLPPSPTPRFDLLLGKTVRRG